MAAVTAPPELREQLRQSHFGWPVSLDFTYDTVRDLLSRGVDGCMVECGVAAGVHPAMIARALLDAQEDRPVHLFDSFEGLPHAGPRDHEFQDAGYGDGTGQLSPIGVAAQTLDAVRANLDAWGVGEQRFVFHPGWYQDTLAAAAEQLGPIALLRLDSDLYESTLVCLEHLYPLLTVGGVCVVDDYVLDGCRAAVDEYLAQVGEEPPLRKLSDHGDVWWQRS